MSVKRVAAESCRTKYAMPIEKKQDYYRALETECLKRTNPFAMLTDENRDRVEKGPSRNRDSGENIHKFKDNMPFWGYFKRGFAHA